MQPTKRNKIIFFLFLIILISFVSFATFCYFDTQSKRSDFRIYTICGHIIELRLVTTFPNEGLYVGFDSGDYRFFDLNYWWAYSHLSLIGPEHNVTLTYERNYYSNTRLLNIRETDI